MSSFDLIAPTAPEGLERCVFPPHHAKNAWRGPRFCAQIVAFLEATMANSSELRG
jgi:hypothetical protein